MARRGNGNNNENRGGKRTPSDPAAVSGPGRLSQRTDGQYGKNPSNATQAARPIPAETYGDRQAGLMLQQAAPMAGAPSTGTNLGAGTNAGSGPPIPIDPFAPNETGQLLQPQSDSQISPNEYLLPNPDVYIQELMRVFPHIDLQELAFSRAYLGFGEQL